MRIIPYTPELLSDVAQMLESQGKNTDSVNDLPQHGLVAYEGETPVACGFIRYVDGHLGLIGEYATNALVSSKTRHEALDRVTEKLISWGKLYNLKGLVMFTSEPTIVKRAHSHGFLLNENMIVSSLKLA
jgi:hypothetical protein